jgi:uracil-DNA glycosylase
MGVYLTTAVKCSKTGYAIGTDTVRVCSYLLEKELALFPNLKAYLLMGDVAIKAVNFIARRSGVGRVIPV